MKVQTAVWLVLALAAGAVACGDDEGGGDGGGGDGGGGGAAAQTSRFFLPTDEPENTTAPTVETDAAGNVHVVYPSYAIGDAFYAVCPGNCTSQDLARAVRFETDGTVHNVMLALDGNGRPHVLMSTMLRVYYASCTSGDCGQAASWTQSVIYAHDGNKEVSGEAFALTADGKPRFLMHAYRALFGIGAPPPATWYVACDAGCHQAASWRVTQIATQTWEESDLVLLPSGKAMAATVANIRTDAGTVQRSAYVECDGAACETDAGWNGIGLFEVYASPQIEEIHPSVALAVTKAGAPRVLTLAKGGASGRQLVYAECASGCTGDAWTAISVSDHAKLGDGVDLALDAEDRPRYVYTLDYNIVLGHCSAATCTKSDAPWALAKVEFGADMPPDDIIPYPNCTVAAWFLHSPSLAIGKDGLPRVGYRAEDISGGWSNPDPTQPGCVAGRDMTFARFAQLSTYAQQ